MTAYDRATKYLATLDAAGLAVVPKEPTMAMLRAAAVVHDHSAVHNYGQPPNDEVLWDAMLAAAKDGQP